MNGAARVWLGGVLAAIGVVCWSVASAIFELAAWEANARFVERVAAVSANAYPNGVSPDVRLKPVGSSMGDVLLWVKDLRWAALALALCGLILVARCTYRTLAFAVLWLTADVLMDRANVEGWLATAISSVVIGTLLVFAARADLRGRDTPLSGGVALTCGAVMTSLASVLFFVEPYAKDDLPAGMLPFAVFLSVSLLVAAVAMALATWPVANPHAMVTGLLLVALIGLSMIVGLVWQMTSDVDPGGAGTIARSLPMLGAPLIVVGCLLLVRGQPTAIGWLGYAGLAVAASGAYFLVMVIGLAVTYALQPSIFPVLGDRETLGFDGYLTPFAAAAAGLLLGVIVNMVSLRPVMRVATVLKGSS